MEKKKKKKITITKFPLANRLGGKSYFLKNKFSWQYIDNNNQGDVFFADENLDRENYHKWVFTPTETPGRYMIRNLKTELYLGSNAKGDLYAKNLDLNSSYQQWMVMPTSEAESYVLVNAGNNLSLWANKLDKLMMNKLESSFYNDCINIILFKIFQFKPKK